MNAEEKKALIEEIIETMNRGFAEFGTHNQDRNNRNYEDRSLRVDVAVFTGQSLNPEDYIDWESSLESYFWNTLWRLFGTTCHAEFAYNRSPSCSTTCSPFECVYEVKPLFSFTLTNFLINDRFNYNAREQAEKLLKIHKPTKLNIVETNARYQHRADKGLKRSEQFQVGDFAWIHLKKEGFPHLRKNKLILGAMGPFQLIAQYGDNKIVLPDEFGISPTFNIRDLPPYLGDVELWAIPFKEGGNKAIMEALDNSSKEIEEMGLHNKAPTTDAPAISLCEQPTLHALAKANLEELGGFEHKNGILAHGTSHPSPKNLLTNLRNPQEKELKVTHSPHNAVRINDQKSDEQPTYTRLCRRDLKSLEGNEGRNGISTLGPFHQAIVSPFSSMIRPPKTSTKVACPKVCCQNVLCTAASFFHCVLIRHVLKKRAISY